MKVLHIVPGTDDVANGMVVVARMLAKEQGDAEVIDLKRGMRGKSIASQITGRSGVSPLREKGNVDFVQKRRDAASPSQRCISNYDEVWVHGLWLPKEWIACWRALRASKRLVRMTHGSLSPLYLKHQSPFIKWLVGPIERFCLRRCKTLIATCEAEKDWIQSYLGKRCPPVVVTDIKRFFCLPDSLVETLPNNRPLHLLYLGRQHPLKGLDCLDEAVKSIQGVELRVVSNAFGDEKERVWEWCDVLVLPTLSENFGLVIAEALERGERVITTDGAPAWGDGLTGLTGFPGLYSGYEGRLIYLKGYRDGTPQERVRLLKCAIASLVSSLTSK